MSIENLARPEIRDLQVYETGVQVGDALRLHANEAPSDAPATHRRNTLNRYPELRPTELHNRLADRFGVPAKNLLATRGSSEAIDLLIRTFCRAGRDNIVITMPTFSMYQVYADIQGAEVISYPLRMEHDFALNVDLLAGICNSGSKLIFICSPNNPTGNVFPISELIKLVTARTDKSIVVVDEAYIEFADTASMADLVADHDNLVVLRTLSKALALAGARCGVAMGSARLIRLLSGVLAPYAISTPVIDCVMSALSSGAKIAGENRIAGIIAERLRVAEQLADTTCVQRLWPSQSNFLLVQFRNLAEIQEKLHAENILIRDISDNPGFENCARITIGDKGENERLLAALRQPEDMLNVG